MYIYLLIVYVFMYMIICRGKGGSEGEVGGGEGEVGGGSEGEVGGGEGWGNRYISSNGIFICHISNAALCIYSITCRCLSRPVYDFFLLCLYRVFQIYCLIYGCYNSWLCKSYGRPCISNKIYLHTSFNLTQHRCALQSNVKTKVFNIT